MVSEHPEGGIIPPGIEGLIVGISQEHLYGGEK